MLFEDGLHGVINKVKIKWKYENDEELVTLIYLVKHYRDVIPASMLKTTIFSLEMLYIPNARMDRVKNNNEVFTLKYFCDVINWLNFDEVIVLDPHSTVSPALLKNVVVMSPQKYIKYAIDDIEGIDIDGGEKYGGKSIIYFPDEGAMKRYGDLSVFGERTIIYGNKVREWKTGKILELTIHTRNGVNITDALGELPLAGEVVLMVDDIVSYGGTMAYSADKLRKLGAIAVYGYASHIENSVLDEEKSLLLKRIKDGTVDGLFTTDSLYSGDYPLIDVIGKYSDVMDQWKTKL